MAVLALLPLATACGGSGGGNGSSKNCLDRGCKITALDGEAREGFGIAVGVSGSIAVVGAPFDHEGGADAGSAYVFRIGNRGAAQEQKLIPADADVDDTFGRSVAVGTEGLIVVGSWNDDDNGPDSGSVYVYHLVGDTWVVQQKLVADDGDADDRFGRSVAISDDVIVVGADRDEVNGEGSGSVYVFRLIGGTWTPEQKLLASDGVLGDDFGDSVAIGGDTIVVGAGGDDGVGADSGAAYIYQFDAGIWTETQILVAFDAAADDQFGDPVAIHGDVIAISADDDDDDGDGSGSVYVYRRNAATWGFDQKIVATDGQEGDDFGESVALDAGTLVVGAIGDDDKGSSSGSVYVYSYDGTDWMETDKLTARDGSDFDDFGTAIAIADGTIVVGADGEDGRGTNSGAAYVFGD